MTRQVFSFAREINAPQGHITSLHPKHPENVPDAWEKAALEGFGRNAKEYGSVEIMNGKRFFRLIRPFAVDEKCSRCHAAEGYKPGDIRGGISVAVPMENFAEGLQRQDRLMWIVIVLLWFMGVCGICWGGRQLVIGRRAFEDANRVLTERVESELAKSRAKDALLLQQARYRTLGELLVNIGHQWRQPLNSVGARIQESAWLIATGEVPREEAVRHAEEIMVSLQELSTSIETLRRLFEPLSATERFLPSEALQKAVSLVSEACASQGISVICDIREEKALVGIQADLVQCLLNLLANARDAILAVGREQGIIRVTVALNETQRLEIRVSDNGGGIVEELLPTLFDPYVTTKFRAQGVGLGLFVVRQIIEQRFNGSVVAGNHAGGAEIIITI
jgi:signal transduction histidine kinase